MHLSDMPRRGSGIPEVKLKEVFEPFFTSKAKGMGMGLSIARTGAIRFGCAGSRINWPHWQRGATSERSGNLPIVWTGSRCRLSTGVM